MTTAYTSLLGLALPVTGELSGTWGDTVNTAITSLLDTAIAGTTSITTDADITLSTTTGASNQARQAIILWNPASGTVTRNITAPAQSKMYVVINASGGTQSIVIRGAGPTTGVTIAKGESATVAWNGSDFVKVSSSGGAITFTDLTVTGNTILGDAAADTLTVNATSTFASPVNFQGQVKLPSTGRSAAAALTPTNPAFLYGVASTYTDTTSSGTLAPVASFYGLAQPTLSTSNVTTYTTAATLYIANAPATGGSATITNPYALYVAAGNSFLGGNLLFTDATYDIGASGATRPRNVYLSGTILRINNSASIGQSIISSAGSATLTLDAATGAGAFSPQILFSSSGTSKWAFGGGNIGSAGATDLAIYDYTNTKLTYSVLAASGNMLMNTNLLFTDNTYNIGANGATRPANLFVAGSSSLGSYVGIGAVATSSYGLDIQTDIGPQIRSLRANNTLDAEAYHLQFARGNGTGNLITMSTTSDGSNGVKKLLWLNSATGSYPLAVTKDGYTGINNSIPATWLHVVGTDNASRGQMTIQSTAANVNPRLTFWYGGGSPSYSLDIYGDTAASNAVYDSGVGYGHKWSVNGSTKLQLNTNALLAMNGATAQSWGTYTSGGILQLDNGAYVVGLDANSTQIGTNGYFNGSNWTYVATGAASNINLDSTGAIYLRTAPSGTAGTSMQSAFNYNLTMFNNGSGTTGTNSFGDPGQSSYPIYVRGSHVSGYGGVFFNSTNTAYYCTRSDDNTTGQGLRMLRADAAERARLSIEPTASQFEFFVNDDVPIKFFTNGTQRWTIDNSATSGNLIANSANIGIKFNKSGALNNQVLNDYEYGTWSPTMGDASNDFTMTESQGSYVKVGRMVYVVGIISWSNKGSASSASGVRIKGLPFPANSDVTNTRVMGMFGAWFATNTNWYTYNTYEGGNVSSLGIEGKNSLTGSSVTLAVSDVSTNTSCRFSLTYYANS